MHLQLCWSHAVSRTYEDAVRAPRRCRSGQPHPQKAGHARTRAQNGGFCLQTFAPSKNIGRSVVAPQPKRVIAAKAAAVEKITKKDVPLALEEGEMPMNTFNSKKPFKATIKSVQRIVGPKVSGVL